MPASDEKPTAFFFCGLTCSGKTTLARHLERGLPGRRYSVDEYVRQRHDLGPMDDGFALLARAARERFWRQGLRDLAAGEHVLFDWNLWSRTRRAKWTARTNAAGYRHVIVYLDVPMPRLRMRLEERNRDSPQWAVAVPVSELDRFAEFFEIPAAEEGVEVRRFTHEDTPDRILKALRHHRESRQ